MSDQPNPADFSINEKLGEFTVRFSVRGEIRTTINAVDLADAKAKANAMLDEVDFGIELDEVEEATVDHVYKSPIMYRVTREESKMQVSRLEVGDIPREPDERGF